MNQLLGKVLKIIHPPQLFIKHLLLLRLQQNMGINHPHLNSSDLKVVNIFNKSNLVTQHLSQQRMMLEGSPIKEIMKEISQQIK